DCACWVEGAVAEEARTRLVVLTGTAAAWLGDGGCDGGAVCVACFGCAVLGAGGAYFFMYSCAPKMTAAISRKTSTKRCSLPCSDCGLLYSGIRLSDWYGNRCGLELDQIHRAQTDDSEAGAKLLAQCHGPLQTCRWLRRRNQ